MNPAREPAPSKMSVSVMLFQRSNDDPGVASEHLYPGGNLISLAAWKEAS